MIKTLLSALALAVAITATLTPSVADAKRFGGGRSAGIQRSLPRQSPDAPAPKPAQPSQANAADRTSATGATASGRRSWMGPIAGLAAGLGIAALMSHFGLGGGLGNLLTIALLAGVAMMAIRFLMSRLKGTSASTNAHPPGGLQWAGANGPIPAEVPARFFSLGAPHSENTNFPRPAVRAMDDKAATAFIAGLNRGQASSGQLAQVDLAEFERIAKIIFIRLQAANDSADLEDLRAFTTPEMFAVVKLDLQDRGGVAQQTDVVRVDAEVIDFSQEADQQLVSVRFHGLIREDVQGVASDFDEIWHLVKPLDGDSRTWKIAGIEQVQ